MIACHPEFDEKSRPDFIVPASVEPLSAILPRLLVERGLAKPAHAPPPVVANTRPARQRLSQRKTLAGNTGVVL